MTKEDYYKALKSRDPRFDGVFFNCVKTTGIYCRPICPTHAPKIENCTFVSTAAEAEKSGYRPCLRCRPELAPLVRLADTSPAHKLCQHIEDTLLLDETLGSVAKQSGVSERHLRRLFVEVYGVEPKQYLTTRRLLFAKQLLQDTAMPIRDVAYSAGFSTPQRLTINMRAAYGFTPERFRKEKPKERPKYLTLRADYRPPFDWDTLLFILAARATPLESIENSVYTRKVQGLTIKVSNDSTRNRLTIQVPIELSRQSHTIVRTTRRLFDLDSDPLAIEASLGVDPFMEKLIRKYPGVRVPGAWNGFELLVRVIIGQQISVAGATTIMKRLVDRIGITIDAIAESSAETIATIGMPKKRAETIYTVAKMIQKGEISLIECDPETFYMGLLELPGIGPWTAEYARLRILHWPDAFPAGDLGVQKALGVNGVRASEKAALGQAEKWRPWRSYATMLLWKSQNNQGG